MATFYKLRKTPDIYPLHGIRVVDGDTIEAEILLPFGCVIVKRIRLKGWWADEPVGMYSGPGLLAKQLLTTWLTGKVIWLHAPSCRYDKYGRVVGHLMHGERIVDPKVVLGHLQLSEKEHNARRAQSKAAAAGSPRHEKALAAGNPSGAQSNGPINDPRAFLDPEEDECDGSVQGLESGLPSPEAANPEAAEWPGR